jgi:hypothetical protein
VAKQSEPFVVNRSESQETTEQGRDHVTRNSRTLRPI